MEAIIDKTQHDERGNELDSKQEKVELEVEPTKEDKKNKNEV